MANEKPIMNRLLAAIADSENDHPSESGEKFFVDLSRKDAMDAVKRIAGLLEQLSEFATALYEVKPDHPLLGLAPSEQK